MKDRMREESREMKDRRVEEKKKKTMEEKQEEKSRVGVQLYSLH